MTKGVNEDSLKKISLVGDDNGIMMNNGNG